MKKALLMILLTCATVNFVYAQSTSDEDGCPITDGAFDPIPGLPAFCYAKYAGSPGAGFPGNPNPIVLNEVTIYPSNPLHPSNPVNPWYPYVFLPVPSPTPSVVNPCGAVARANANAQVAGWINTLRGSTALNHERGVLFYGDNPIPIQGNAGEAGIGFGLYDKINGLMHSHYTGLLPIYSFDDLTAMAQLYKGGLMSDPNSFFSGVFTASGTGYMLAIDNPALFSTFADLIISANPHGNPLAYIYDEVYVNRDFTVEQNLKGFLQFLDTHSSGLKLFEYNSTNKTWTPKKVVNNTVIQNPC
jgi:hypothetical protein